MGKYTKEDIFRMIREDDVEFIRLQFTDIFGVLKNLAITTSQLEKALNNRIMFDGSAIDGFVGIEESDLYLHPDLDTFTIFPWRPQKGKVARFICDIYYPDGKPFEGDSRAVLKRVLEKAASEGCRFLIGPECEFFLFHLDDNGLPTTLSHEQAGYFDVSPLDLGENARRDIDLTMEEMGYRVDGSHHEYAAAQHEIDLHYSEALEAADTIETFRLAARTIARRHGLHATFMPKPCNGVHGSGMHINISMLRNGINVFSDENDPNGLSREALYFIGGLMEHIPGMTAILNPVVNSYKRLATGYEAPRYNAWSATNRSMLVRVPALRGFNTRIELRSPDSTANPYLTLALCIAAGMDGIRREIMPPASIEKSIGDMTAEEIKQRGIASLPVSLGEALERMRGDSFTEQVIGEHIKNHFLSAKSAEWNEYIQQVTDWELKNYLSRF